MPCSVSCSAWLNSSLATHALTPYDLAHMETTATVRGSRESQQAWDLGQRVSSVRLADHMNTKQAVWQPTSRGGWGHRGSASHLEHQS